ncbi:MAG: bifunctional diaminohydroxyphosphoribosylaminopyrimidine deaminase/5-amino-6-(5-phosphoribosylamino)uracil reductase RibD [Sphingobacteriaceae bacterium]
MSTDELYMQRCIDLARLGLASVSPNPMVGAVVVANGQIIGEGYHQKYGEVHAEVNAINSVFAQHADAAEILKTATIYVSLEPCAHFGKTPPCSDLIIKHQLKKVVIGCRDAFAEVNGKGISKLQAAGIEVKEGVLEAKCLDLNKRFFTRIGKQRPYIILKWAHTADGFFAPEENEQKWISSLAAKQLSHQWRSEEDAILVGYRTALTDNPELNIREWSGKNPKRIVVDRNLSLPADLHLFDQSQETMVFNALKTYRDGRIQYLELENFDTLLPQSIAYQLYLLDVQSLIVEGGAQTLESFIRAGLWDEARVFTSAQNWHSGIKAPELGLSPACERQVDTDTLKIYYNL